MKCRWRRDEGGTGQLSVSGTQMEAEQDEHCLGDRSMWLRLNVGGVKSRTQRDARDARPFNKEVSGALVAIKKEPSVRWRRICLR